jgi:hypothetical protein
MNRLLATVVGVLMAAVTVSAKADECDVVFKDEKAKMNSCTERNCDRYTRGAQQNLHQHGLCMDDCAKKQSEKYWSCYRELLGQASKQGLNPP